MRLLLALLLAGPVDAAGVARRVAPSSPAPAAPLAPALPLPSSMAMMPLGGPALAAPQSLASSLSAAPSAALPAPALSPVMLAADPELFPAAPSLAAAALPAPPLSTPSAEERARAAAAGKARSPSPAARAAAMERAKRQDASARAERAREQVESVERVFQGLEEVSAEQAAASSSRRFDGEAAKEALKLAFDAGNIEETRRLLDEGVVSRGLRALSDGRTGPSLKESPFRVLAGALERAALDPLEAGPEDVHELAELMGRLRAHVKGYEVPHQPEEDAVALARAVSARLEMLAYFRPDLDHERLLLDLRETVSSHGRPELRDALAPALVAFTRSLADSVKLDRRGELPGGVVQALERLERPSASRVAISLSPLGWASGEARRLSADAPAGQVYVAALEKALRRGYTVNGEHAWEAWDRELAAAFVALVAPGRLADPEHREHAAVVLPLILARYEALVRWRPGVLLPALSQAVRNLVLYGSKPPRAARGLYERSLSHARRLTKGATEGGSTALVASGATHRDEPPGAGPGRFLNRLASFEFLHSDLALTRARLERLSGVTRVRYFRREAPFDSNLAPTHGYRVHFRSVAERDAAKGEAQAALFDRSLRLDLRVEGGPRETPTPHPTDARGARYSRGLIPEPVDESEAKGSLLPAQAPAEALRPEQQALLARLDAYLDESPSRPTRWELRAAFKAHPERLSGPVESRLRAALGESLFDPAGPAVQLRPSIDKEKLDSAMDLYELLALARPELVSPQLSRLVELASREAPGAAPLLLGAEGEKRIWRAERLGALYAKLTKAKSVSWLDGEAFNHAVAPFLGRRMSLLPAPVLATLGLGLATLAALPFASAPLLGVAGSAAVVGALMAVFGLLPARATLRLRKLLEGAHGRLASQALDLLSERIYADAHLALDKAVKAKAELLALAQRYVGDIGLVPVEEQAKALPAPASAAEAAGLSAPPASSSGRAEPALPGEKLGARLARHGGLTIETAPLSLVEEELRAARWELARADEQDVAELAALIARYAKDGRDEETARSESLRRALWRARSLLRLRPDLSRDALQDALRGLRRVGLDAYLHGGGFLKVTVAQDALKLLGGWALSGSPDRAALHAAASERLPGSTETALHDALSLGEHAGGDEKTLGRRLGEGLDASSPEKAAALRGWTRSSLALLLERQARAPRRERLGLIAELGFILLVLGPDDHAHIEVYRPVGRLLGTMGGAFSGEALQGLRGSALLELHAQGAHFAPEFEALVAGYAGGRPAPGLLLDVLERLHSTPPHARPRALILQALLDARERMDGESLSRLRAVAGPELKRGGLPRPLRRELKALRRELERMPVSPKPAPPAARRDYADVRRKRRSHDPYGGRP